MPTYVREPKMRAPISSCSFFTFWLPKEAPRWANDSVETVRAPCDHCNAFNVSIMLMTNLPNARTQQTLTSEHKQRELLGAFTWAISLEKESQWEQYTACLDAFS